MDDTIGPVMLLQILSPEGVVLDEYEACGVHPSVVDLLATKQAGLYVVIGEKTMTTNTTTVAPAAAPTAAPAAPVAPAATTTTPPNLLAALGLDPEQLSSVMSALGTGMGASLAPMIGEAVGSSMKASLEGLRPVLRMEAKEAMKELMAEEAKKKDEETDWAFWGGCAAGGAGLLMAGYSAWQVSKMGTLLEGLATETKPDLPAITM